jgi:hypothetical protein
MAFLVRCLLFVGLNAETKAHSHNNGPLNRYGKAHLLCAYYLFLSLAANEIYHHIKKLIKTIN